MNKEDRGHQALRPGVHYLPALLMLPSIPPPGGFTTFEGGKEDSPTEKINGPLFFLPNI